MRIKKKMKTRIENALDNAVLYRDEYVNALRRLRNHIKTIEEMIDETEAVFSDTYYYDYDECAESLEEDIDYDKHSDILQSIQTDVDDCVNRLWVADEYTTKFLGVYEMNEAEDEGDCDDEDEDFEDDDEDCCYGECDEDDSDDFAPDDEELDEELSNEIDCRCQKCMEFKEGRCDGIMPIKTKPTKQHYKKSGE